MGEIAGLAMAGDICETCGGWFGTPGKGSPRRCVECTRFDREQARKKKGPTAAEWNAKHPVGTAVRYYPILGEMNSIDTKTRSEAWTLGHGEAVVSIEGRTGGVALSHLQMIAAKAT